MNIDIQIPSHFLKCSCVFFIYLYIYIFISDAGTGQDDEISECGSSSDMICDEQGCVLDSNTCFGAAASHLGENFDSDLDGDGSRHSDDDDNDEDSRASSTPHFDHQENSPTSSIKEEIVSCILRGLILAEEMKTSVKSMENLLEYAKGLYCKGDPNLEKYWPSNWRETEKLLKEVGYEDPKQYFICLDASHYANYDIMEDKNSH